MSKLINYGVNIKFKGQEQWQRFTTVTTLDKALTVYNVINVENEIWDTVEIERIEQEERYGDAIYTVILRSDE